MADAEAGGETPPSYHDEKPPSYESLFGKVKQAKSESSGNVDYICRVFTLLFCGTFCTAIYLVFMFALPIAMVTIGAIHKDHCPVQKYIPIYLIVGGSFGIFVGIITTCSNIIKCCRRAEEDEQEKRKPNPFSSLINLFLLAWFIAGNYWVYHIHNTVQSDDPSELNTYCDKTLYLFAFWLITASYIALGLALLCCCGLGIFMLCLGTS
jgi:hypothetical protein